MIIKSGLPKVSYRLLVILACSVSALTVWGWVMDHWQLLRWPRNSERRMTLFWWTIDREEKEDRMKSLYNIDGPCML